MFSSALITRRSVLQTAAAITAESLVSSSTADVSRPQSLQTLNTGYAIPTVGYSFFKTPDRTEECVNLALHAGIRHFDCATQYKNNVDVGHALIRALPKLGVERAELFLTHKLSNDEQSSNKRTVKLRVKKALKDLKTAYLDLCMLHSPLTSKERLLASYEALWELHEDGLVRSVGVCNFGIQPLQVIVDAGLASPAVIQLQLSPFNQHKDVVEWASSKGCAVSSSAWSRLSSVDGPVEGWAVIASLAKKTSVTKAQVLVRWAIQKGYTCVPRSSANSKIERLAIAENSFKGCSTFSLSEEQMSLIDRLDLQLPAGQLGVTDGYEAEDIISRDWDPTIAMV